MVVISSYNSLWKNMKILADYVRCAVCKMYSLLTFSCQCSRANIEDKAPTFSIYRTHL